MSRIIVAIISKWSILLSYFKLFYNALVICANGPYAKLFKIINFKGAGGPMFKTYQCAPYTAVMTISEFEPHSRFHS